MKVLHVPPYNYVHLKDKSENTIFLIEGPTSYVLQSHEELVKDVTPMLIIPPNNFIFLPGTPFEPDLAGIIAIILIFYF